MAQKLLKPKQAKIAPKKDAAQESSIVLVGTYREGQLAWIKKNGVYNYPVKDGDELTDEACGKVKELWLYADMKSTRHAFAAAFVGKMSREEFLAEHPTYAKLSSGRARSPSAPHKAYYVFKTTPLDYGPMSDGPLVIARTADFGGRSAKIKKAIEQFKADGEFAPLAAYLPSDLATVPHQQLRVCEAAVQLNFFPVLLKPATVMKNNNKPKFTFFDLFAGCGGLSLGLERAGFTPLLVNELNPDAMSTYLLNRRDEFPWLCDNNVSNVKDLVLNEKLLDGFHESIKQMFGIDIYKGQLDLICGGPPCQGFSGLGIRRSYSVEKKQLPSNFLYQDMAFLINRLRPKIFLFENVRGLLSAKWTNDGEKVRSSKTF